MQTSKLITLILKIFGYSAFANTLIFFIAVYINSMLATAFLPANTHIETTFTGAFTFALYNGIELGLFFTTFTMLIIRLSITSGSILTLRDIVQYYRKFIIITIIAITLLVSLLCVIITNTLGDLHYITNVLLGGPIINYVLPFFWVILAAIYYSGYQSKLNDPDGCKDRSWLEGNTEK